MESSYIDVVGESMGKGCDIKTQELGKHLLALTEDLDVSFLDLKDKVNMAAPDYTHLNKEGHAAVSTIMANKIKSLNL